MPAHTTCPISDVDRALSSYINSREQTLRIRRTLSKYHTASLRPATANVQNQHLNQQCPYSTTAATTNPPGLDGQRIEYLKALRDLHQARTRHQQLQSSLTDLRTSYTDENPSQPSSGHDNEASRSYFLLLRQRRRLAELEAIQQALDKVYAAKPPQVPQDLKLYIKQSMGEQPDLPVERLEQLSNATDNDAWIFKVKQEVLEAKTNMEKSQAAKRKAEKEAQGSASLQSQVLALQSARDEIVEWVQNELSKMEEESIFLEDASPVKRSLVEAVPINADAAEKEIRSSYDNYTESRAKLVQSQESLHASLATEKPPTDSASSSKDDSKSQDSELTLCTVKLLPHLPRLIQTVQSERALLQQSLHLQTQISSTDQEITETLVRLAGESHLLPGGSTKLEAWGKTSQEADAATEAFVREQLQASKEELSNVSAIVKLTSLQSEILASTK